VGGRSGRARIGTDEHGRTRTWRGRTRTSTDQHGRALAERKEETSVTWEECEVDERGGEGGQSLIPKHGGYRKLKSFQIAQLVYDVTVRFCERYVDVKSRTRDQMVQAARSGVQNIAEGSQASGTSKKSELKLTNVARASLEELRLDYEDFLRQRGMVILPPEHPVLERFKKRRCSTLEEVQAWVAEERGRQNTDEHGPAQTHTDGRAGNTEDDGVNVSAQEGSEVLDCGFSSSVSVRECPCSSMASSCLVANAVLSLLNVACHLLDRQLAAQARAFEQEGGFTERLYHQRIRARDSEK
jgi:four helix bundle suffix protein